MSAPAGWHLQPDGRERFWDGTRWTEQFRAVDSPQQSDPTAPPPAPSWAQSGDDGSSSGGDPTAPVSDPTSEAATPAWDQTQALDVSSTQAIPAPRPSAGDQGQSSYGSSDPYASQPSAFGAGAGAAGYGAPASGYGAPGAPGQPGQPGPGWQPPQKGGNGWLKGCLIGLVVLLVLGIAGVVAAVFFFSRAVDQVSEGISSSLPSGFPSDLPSNLPSNLPTDLPTDGLGEQVDITVGRGFEIPRATIEDGWSLDKQGAGALSVVTVNAMKATLQDQDGFPVLFTISFPPAGGGDAVQTVCTAPAGSAGATVDVTCVPLLGDVADARQGTVTTTL